MLMEMTTDTEKTLHIGADLDDRFVLRFRKHCRNNNYKQLAVIQQVIKWWLTQDRAIQEHIYYGRFSEVQDCFRKEATGPISPEDREFLEAARQLLAADSGEPAENEVAGRSRGKHKESKAG